VSRPTPVPRRLYVHDDLSEVLRRHPEGSPVRRLGEALLARLARDTDRVVILTLEAQLEAMAARGPHPPFPLALGIGAAGTRVASEIHARTGWFPVVRRIDVWREEDGEDYVLGGPAPLAAQLAARLDAHAGGLAVVDDTVFSGLTLRAVLAALPQGVRRRTHAFCLRAVAESLAEVGRLAPVTAAFTAAGRPLEDVSLINASGLVRRGAIRRRGAPPLAFYERPEWMAAWFPGYHEEVTALCRALHAALEGAVEAAPSATPAG
jgi:hypothetical protein